MYIAQQQTPTVVLRGHQGDVQSVVFVDNHDYMGYDEGGYLIAG